MIIKILVCSGDKFKDVPIVAKDVFEAMKIAKSQGYHIVDDYILQCWHNGKSIN